MTGVKLLAVAVLGLAPLAAHADDWACEVVLCLANPAGAMAVSQCVPPIKKLYKELAKGHAFPTCNMNSTTSQGNSAKNTMLNGRTCPGQFRFYVGKIPFCQYQGVIDVKVSNQPYTRVYWSEGSTFTEGGSVLPPATPPGDDAPPPPGQFVK
jgi:hypothetical protein